MGVDYSAWCGFGVYLDHQEAHSQNGKKLFSLLEEQEDQDDNSRWTVVSPDSIMGDSGRAVVLTSSYRSVDVKYGEDPVEIPVLTKEELEIASAELAGMLVKYGFADIPEARWLVGGRTW
jgi:hypothetical protein